MSGGGRREVAQMAFNEMRIRDTRRLAMHKIVLHNKELPCPKCY